MFFPVNIPYPFSECKSLPSIYRRQWWDTFTREGKKRETFILSCSLSYESEGWQSHMRGWVSVLERMTNGSFWCLRSLFVNGCG
ncbi:hypothetical protein CEXT_377031 [Caerostris extrusa]|uniref:Uncharacterized protein n=1 Tax=Caerostris extrusa TaxID=172846 RepID=A0AAV4W5R6_CAEEX|nr:hypothetical protein CEXT_377031 [Caerostris extrusa]